MLVTRENGKLAPLSEHFALFRKEQYHREIFETSWEPRLRSGFGTMYENIMVKIVVEKKN